MLTGSRDHLRRRQQDRALADVIQGSELRKEGRFAQRQLFAASTTGHDVQNVDPGCRQQGQMICTDVLFAIFQCG